MLRNLPELIHPLQLARAGRALCGRVTLTRMRRLQPLLAEVNARDAARVELRFGPDDSGHLGIQGRVEADLNLICQRCLKTVPFRVESEVRLGLISANDPTADDKIGHLNESHPTGGMAPGFEPLMVAEDEALALPDMVEDELLLALPIAPMHPEGICSISKRYSSMNPVQDRRESPFAVLVVGKPAHSNHEE